MKVIRLVSVCHYKSGRFLSFREAFGQAMCPLLFFNSPRSLGRPSAKYSSLGLVFFSSEGCECDRASICLLVLARVVGSCHLGRPSAKYSSLLDLVFFSSEGCECDRASIYMSSQGC